MSGAAIAALVVIGWVYGVVCAAADLARTAVLYAFLLLHRRFSPDDCTPTDDGGADV